MNILLIYPEKENNEKGFWKFIQKQINKQEHTRRELIEISIQLPITWERKLIDLNYNKIESNDIERADYVILKADKQQEKSTTQLINKCKLLGKKTIGIGELFDGKSENFKDIDHLILDQSTIEPFVFDVENDLPRKTYGLQFLKNQVKYSRDSLMRISNSLSKNIQTFSV